MFDFISKLFGGGNQSRESDEERRRREAAARAQQQQRQAMQQSPFGQNRINNAGTPNLARPQQPNLVQQLPTSLQMPKTSQQLQQEKQALMVNKDGTIKSAIKGKEVDEANAALRDGNGVKDIANYYGEDAKNLRDELMKAKPDVNHIKGLTQSIRNRQRELSAKQDDLAGSAPNVITRQNSIQKGINEKKSIADIASNTGLSKDEVQLYIDSRAKGYMKKSAGQNVADFGKDMFQGITQIARRPAATLGAAANQDDMNEALSALNESYKSGSISQSRLKQEFEALTGDIIGNTLKVNENGIVKASNGEQFKKFAGQTIDAGVNASDVIPVAGGVSTAFREGTKSTGKAITKDIVKQSLINNAKQAAVFGTTATGADIINDRGVSPLSLALNYGAPLALGTGSELAARSIKAGSSRLAEAIINRRPENIAAASPAVTKFQPQIDDLSRMIDAAPTPEAKRSLQKQLTQVVDQQYAAKRQAIRIATKDRQAGYIRIPGAREAETKIVNELARSVESPADFLTAARENPAVDAVITRVVNEDPTVKDAESTSRLSDDSASQAEVTLAKQNAYEQTLNDIYRQSRGEVELENAIKEANPNLKVSESMSPEQKRVTLENAQDQAKKVNQDAGEKMFGSRKDMSKLNRIDNSNLRDVEAQGDRVAAKMVTKQRVLGENARFEPNRSGDPSVEYAKSVYLGAIPGKPAPSRYGTPEQKAAQDAAHRAKYVEDIPSYAQAIRNAQSLAEIREITTNFHDKYIRRMSDNDYYTYKGSFKDVYGSKFYNMVTRRSRAALMALSVYNPKTDFSWAEKVTRTATTRDTAKPTIHSSLLVDYKRVGGKEVGKITTEQAREMFKFKGLEYGNSMNDIDAAEHLTRFAEGMSDMGDLLNMDVSQLIEKMNLGIAFGARGKKGALAHYEPANKVINITRKAGADGSLSHELAHAIDDFLSGGSGGGRSSYASSGKSTDPVIKDAMRRVMKTLKEGGGVLTVRKNESARPKTYGIVRQMIAAGNTPEEIMDEIIRKYPGTSNRQLNDIAQSIMLRTEATELKVPRSESQYLLDSQELGEYWARDTEMFARAFADYLRSISGDAGVSNNYLHPTDKAHPVFNPANMETEVAPAMKNLVDAIKEEYNIADAPVRDESVQVAQEVVDNSPQVVDNSPEAVEQVIDNMNPTGGLMVDYDPQSRVTARLGENITTLDKTMGGKADDTITIYRGAPSNQAEIAPGDFVTTSRELAESYTGDGNVIEMQVRKGDVLDDASEPLGDEYIYRPNQDSLAIDPATGNSVNGGGAGKVVDSATTPEANKMAAQRPAMNIIDEAKRYKTVDDFVKAQGKPLYHGTDATFDKFSLRDFGRTDDGFSGRGVYLTASKKNAKQYGKNVVESYINLKNPLVYEDSYLFGAFSPSKLREKVGLDGNATAKQLSDKLRALGHDGLVINERTDTGVNKNAEVVVFDPEVINTRKQLEDIYATANATPSVENLKKQSGYLDNQKKKSDSRDEDNAILIGKERDAAGGWTPEKALKDQHTEKFRTFVKENADEIANQNEDIMSQADQLRFNAETANPTGSSNASYDWLDLDNPEGRFFAEHMESPYDRYNTTPEQLKTETTAPDPNQMSLLDATPSDSPYSRLSNADKAYVEAGRTIDTRVNYGKETDVNTLTQQDIDSIRGDVISKLDNGGAVTTKLNEAMEKVTGKTSTTPPKKDISKRKNTNLPAKTSTPAIPATPVTKTTKDSSAPAKTSNLPAAITPPKPPRKPPVSNTTDAPATPPVKQKKSRLANVTVPKSEVVSKELRAKVKETQTMYTVETERARFDDSLNRMQKQGADKFADQVHSKFSESLVDGKKTRFTSQDLVDGETAASYYDVLGDDVSLAKATAIYSAMSKSISRSGQEVQVAAALSRRTPEGLRYQGTRQMAEDAEAYAKTRRGRREAKRTGRDVSQPDPEAIKQLTQFTDKVKNADKTFKDARAAYLKDKTPDNKAKMEQAQIDKDIARDNVQYHVASNTKTATADLVVNFWRAGLLTAPRTTFGAVASGIGEGIQRKLWNDPVATMYDMTRTLFYGGDRTVMLPGAGSTRRGFKAGVKNATSKQYWKTGKDELNSMNNENQSGSQSRQLNYGKGRLGRATTGYVNGVYRLMGAADQPFRYATYDNVLSSLSKTDALNRKLKGTERQQHIDEFMANPPEWARERALNEALDSTFQSKNPLGSVISGMKMMARNQGLHKTAALLDFLIPFAGVPSSIAVRIIRRTPIGTANEIVKQIHKVKISGEMDAFDHRKLAQAFAEGASGVPIIAAGYALGQAGLLTGAYPSDSKERQRWIDEGKQENSVKIGDRYYSLNYIQPFGALLQVGAGMSQADKSGLKGWEKTAAITASSSKSFLGQSYLEGIQAPIDAINDPERAGERFVASTASSAVPNLIRSFATASDSKQRDASGVVDGVKSAIPGLRQTLNPKLDSQGRDLPRNDSFLNLFINPLKPSKQRGTDAVTGEVYRLLDTGNGITMSPDKKLTASGETVKMDKDQQLTYNRAVGQMINSQFDAIIGSAEYKTLDDAGKAKMLTNAANAVQSVQKKQMLADMGRQDVADKVKLTAKENRLADGKATTQMFQPEAAGGSTPTPKSLLDDGDYVKFRDAADVIPSSQKDAWLESAPEVEYQKLVDRANKTVPDGFPPLANTNATAKRYADFLKSRAEGNWSKLQNQKETNKFVRDAYGDMLTKDDKFIAGLPDKELLQAVNDGQVSKESLDNIIALDNILAQLGGTMKIGKTTRAKLGYGAAPGSSGGSGGGGKKSIGFQAPDTAKYDPLASTKSIADILKRARVS